jgi:putative serine protease PepD
MSNSSSSERSTSPERDDTAERGARNGRGRPDTGQGPAYPADRPSSPAPRRLRVGLLAAFVVVALVTGGIGFGLGRWLDRSAPASPPTAVGTLRQPAPPANDLPVAPVTVVARKVLPSVVQLVGGSGEGSGVILSADGLILTNAHVLAAAAGGQLTATFQNGATAQVLPIGADSKADVAVVRAQRVSGLTPIQLGNSEGLQVGQPVVAIGSPLGLAGTVTNGIVSALNRPVEVTGEPKQGQAAPQSVLDAIQTDAAINPGNSGGPLVDMEGRIVGLNSAIASLGSNRGGQTGSIGLGFAIPINQAKRIADELIATGHANQAQLGVSVRDAQPSGALVLSVQPNTAAGKAGLQPGDVVLKVGDRLLDGADALVAAINSAEPGSTVQLTVRSGDNHPHVVPVTLDSVPAG